MNDCHGMGRDMIQIRTKSMEQNIIIIKPTEEDGTRQDCGPVPNCPIRRDTINPTMSPAKLLYLYSGLCLRESQTKYYFVSTKRSYLKQNLSRARVVQWVADTTHCGVRRWFKSHHRHFRASKHAQLKCFSTRTLRQAIHLYVFS